MFHTAYSISNETISNETISVLIDRLLNVRSKKLQSYLKKLCVWNLFRTFLIAFFHYYYEFKNYLRSFEQVILCIDRP